MSVRRRRLFIAAALSAGLLLAAPVGAADAAAAGGGGGGPHACTEQQRVIANPDAAPSALFGRSVAIGRGRLLVGSPSDRFQVARPGAAYLFDAGGKLEHRLANPAPASADEFGWSVALHGRLAAVGAPEQGGGTVHVYRASSGKLVRSIGNPAPAPDDRFGESVALSGTRLLAGASGTDDGGDPYAGVAHLFDATSGKLLRTFHNPEPGSRQGFGASVAIDGDRALIGAGGFGGTLADGSRDGAAYLFDLRTGALLQTFHNPGNPDRSESFGLAVALDGRRALIGARGNRNGGQDLSGAAFVFDTRTGDLETTLLNPAPDAVDFFGDAVALDGGTALVGAPLDRTASAAGGSAYLIDVRRNRVVRSWSGGNGEGLGAGVALDGDRAVAGAPLADTGSGEVWLLGPGCHR